MNTKIVRKRIVKWVIITAASVIILFSTGFVKLPEAYYCWQAKRSADTLQEINEYLVGYCNAREVSSVFIRKSMAQFNLKYFEAGKHTTNKIEDYQAYANLNKLFFRLNIEVMSFSIEDGIEIEAKADQGIIFSGKEIVVSDSVKRFKHVVDNLYYVEYKTTMDYEREMENYYMKAGQQ